MYEKERDCGMVVEALGPVLHNLPGKIIAIGGRPGVGKTTLGRFLAYRFNVSLIETDLFLICDQGRMIYMNSMVAQAIAARIDRDDPRPVIVEGSSVLRLLAELKRHPDFTIHIMNKDAPESHGSFLADIEGYEAEFRPAAKADLVLYFEGCE